MRTPQAGNHTVAAGRHHLRDEGVEVGGAELRLQGQHDLGVRRALGQRLQDTGLQIVPVGVVELQVAEILEVVLGDQHGHRVAFDIGVRGDAEDEGVQLGGGDLDGLRDGRDIDHLLLLRDLRHAQADRGAQATEDDVHLVLCDQLFHCRRCGRGVHLVVALDRFDLAAHDAAAPVDLLDRKLVPGQRRHAVDRAATCQRIHRTDANRLLRQCLTGDHHADGHEHQQSLHKSSPPLCGFQ